MGRERGGVGLLGLLSAGLRHGSAFRKGKNIAELEYSAMIQVYDRNTGRDELVVDVDLIYQVNTAAFQQ